MAKSNDEKAEIRRQTEARRKPDKDRADHEASRGKRNRNSTIGQLSRTELTDEEFEAALQAILKESDRGVAIMGAALVENGLIVALDAKLLNSADRGQVYHEQGAPLGTLSNKIVMARALGLIDSHIVFELNVIRNIRNQFSHALRSLTFGHPLIFQECLKLGDYSAQPVAAYDGLPDPSKPRWRYIFTCVEMYRVLLRAATKALNTRHQGLIGQHVNALAPTRTESSKKN